MKSSSRFPGAVFVTVGTVVIISKLLARLAPELPFLWPPIFILLGVLFMGYFYSNTKKSPQVLIPGGVLFALGALMIYEQQTQWLYHTITESLYTATFTLGLLPYFLETKSKNILGVMTCCGIVAFLDFTTTLVSYTPSLGALIIIFILLIIGIYLGTKE